MNRKRQLERRWALVRMALGMLQMTGAMTGAILLIETGVTPLAVSVATATALFTAISLTLFKGK